MRGCFESWLDIAGAGWWLFAMPAPCTLWQVLRSFPEGSVVSNKTAISAWLRLSLPVENKYEMGEDGGREFDLRYGVDYPM